MAISLQNMLHGHVDALLERVDGLCFADAVAAGAQTAAKLAASKTGRSVTVWDVCAATGIPATDYAADNMLVAALAETDGGSRAERWVSVVNRCDTPQRAALLALAACVDTLAEHGPEQAKAVRAALQRDGGQRSLWDLHPAPSVPATWAEAA